MNRALILGCSHAAGSEISKDPSISTTFASSRDAHSFEQARSYPAKIATALGFMVDNKAIPGGSNDSIFRIYEASKLEPGDIVIACWTGVNRTEILYQGQWRPVAAGFHAVHGYEEYQKQWLTYHADEETGRQNKIKNVLALNSLAEMRGIKVLNIDSFWVTARARWPKNVVWGTYQDFWSYCNDRNFPKTESGHYFLEAHQSFADFVMRSIESTFFKVTE